MLWFARQINKETVHHSEGTSFTLSYCLCGEGFVINQTGATHRSSKGGFLLRSWIELVLEYFLCMFHIIPFIP